MQQPSLEAAVTAVTLGSYLSTAARKLSWYKSQHCRTRFQPLAISAYELLVTLEQGIGGGLTGTPTKHIVTVNPTDISRWTTLVSLFN
jgi:hypothetical protein